MKPYLKITLTLFIIITIVLGFALPLNMPPGWYQQTLPVNDNINDIFFIDTSNGWLVTQGGFPSNDTSFIMHTTNSGNNWFVQTKNRENLNVIQFLDVNTGYAAGGGNGSTNTTFYKTTNSGTNWITVNNLGGIQLKDMYFINKDTGWVCDDDFTFGAGLQKTTNGGISWVQQLPRSFRPYKLFFISKDTGWAACNNVQLYKTTNGGTNWNLQYTFTPFDNSFRSIFFINNTTGWSTHYTPLDTNGVYITTNGGFNWITQRGPDATGSGMSEVQFINTLTGYIAAGDMLKTTNGGTNWNKQVSPGINYKSVSFVTSSFGWAAGLIIIHTTDGGGPTGIQQINSEIPMNYMLFQNYPNPFNPKTNFKYQIIKSSFILLSVYDITGKHLINLVNQEQSAGTYLADWNASGYSSGVYFYALIVNGLLFGVKKMILLK